MRLQISEDKSNWMPSTTCAGLEWDPWGVPDDYDHDDEVSGNDAPVPKHVSLYQPGPLPGVFYKKLEAATLHSKQDDMQSHPMSCN
ncbi:hypothetical protein F0562_021779 [Nyssa sinensis]|uniref:Uncharacterized protein n=1 Tax=Nyssa sinensis TaxID=561372 RepID=A0A5J5BMY9_9ASTE|nr:hypothetical protein F0562_021779 [Nyssa sinensis]